jgi:hypothetical protein
MSLPEEQLEQLTNEQLAGGRAQHAYNEFIKDFCEKKRKILFQNFADLALTDEANIMEVKRMLFAVDTLEADIMTVIETGKMASITLNQQEVKH